MVYEANAASLALNSNGHSFIYSFFQQISLDIYSTWQGYKGTSKVWPLIRWVNSLLGNDNIYLHDDKVQRAKGAQMLWERVGSVKKSFREEVISRWDWKMTRSQAKKGWIWFRIKYNTDNLKLRENVAIQGNERSIWQQKSRDYVFYMFQHIFP